MVVWPLADASQNEYGEFKSCTILLLAGRMNRRNIQMNFKFSVCLIVRQECSPYVS